MLTRFLGAAVRFTISRKYQPTLTSLITVLVAQSPDRNILLSVKDRDTEKIDIFYSSDTGDANNMDFSFVTNVSVPKSASADRQRLGAPLIVSLAFSTDGSKFATAKSEGVVSVWDVRSQVPLMVLAVEKQPDGFMAVQTLISYLQFSKGILGREVLVFMEVS